MKNDESAPFLSVIVTAYNNENYISTCLDSIFKQDFDDFEVIIVDDGSIDDTGKICDSFSVQNKNFFVIHQKNKGALSARMSGLAESKGKYVIFIDGDDYIEPDMLSSMCSVVKKDDSSVVLCLKSIYDESKNYIAAESPVLPDGIYLKTDGKIYSNILYQESGQEGLSINLYDKIIKKDIAIEAFQQADRRLHYFEDGIISIPVLLSAEQVSILNEPFYVYRQHSGSICHKEDSLYLEQLDIFYDYIKKYFVYNGYFSLIPKLDRFLVQHVYYGINNMMGISSIRIPYYVPDMSLFDKDDRIVIYGAGLIGKDYYKFMHLMCPERIAAWVDKRSDELRKEGLDVINPENLSEICYDKILIAVMFKDGADMIKDELVRSGIQEDKIVWKPARSVVD